MLNKRAYKVDAKVLYKTYYSKSNDSYSKIKWYSSQGEDLYQILEQYKIPQDFVLCATSSKKDIFPYYVIFRE